MNFWEKQQQISCTLLFFCDIIKLSEIWILLEHNVMELDWKKLGWVFYIVIAATILSAVYTITLEPVPFGISHVGMYDVSHSMPESSSQNLGRPIGVLVIDQIVRAGKNPLYDAVIGMDHAALLNSFLNDTPAVESIWLLLLLYCYIHSRTVSIRFIHNKDGAKGLRLIS